MSEERIRIFDTTLRDGEQSPGCSMKLNEKLALARQLQKLGVDVIEAGFPIASDGDFESVRAIAEEIRETSIAGLARTASADIERAAQALEGAAKPRIHTFIATSDIHLEHKLRMSREQVLEEVRRAVTQARQHCDDVEFSAEDATRSEWDYLVEVFSVALDAGASTLNVPDTVGYTTPIEYHDLIRYLCEKVPGSERAIFSLHCHNDLGLAVANSLAAIRAGARQVECTVNGIGERAGNTSLEEVVMALRTRREVYDGLDTRIRTSEIYPASRMLSKITGVAVQPNKAIVGQNAFAHEAGIHQDGVLKAAITYEIMTPQSIGRTSNELVLGKHSGRHAFRDRLAELGFDVEGDEFDEAFKRFKALADKKKTIYVEDLEAILAESGEVRRRSLRPRRPGGGERDLCHAERDGSADGGRAGEEDLLHGRRPRGRCLQGHRQAHREQERAGPVPGEGDHRGHGRPGQRDRHSRGRRAARDRHGAHTDIIVASGKAYVHALNRLDWHKRRRKVDEPKGI